MWLMIGYRNRSRKPKMVHGAKSLDSESNGVMRASDEDKPP